MVNSALMERLSEAKNHYIAFENLCGNLVIKDERKPLVDIAIFPSQEIAIDKLSKSHDGLRQAGVIFDSSSKMVFAATPLVSAVETFRGNSKKALVLGVTGAVVSLGLNLIGRKLDIHADDNGFKLEAVEEYIPDNTI